MPKSLLLIFVSILALVVLVVFTSVVLPNPSRRPAGLTTVPDQLSEPPITIIDPIRGNPDANVTIVEYGDYVCPECHVVEPVLSQLIAEAPHQRRLVWKDAPNTQLHPLSATAAMAARCAQDQGAFWAYHDALLASNSTITAESLATLANTLNLNVDSFDRCMSEEVTRPVVEHTLEEAISLGVNGTPAIFLNGALYEGALTLEALRAAIQAL